MNKPLNNAKIMIKSFGIWKINTIFALELVINTI